jgi:hypothetical protein
MNNMVSKPITPAEEERLKTLREAKPNTWLALDESRTRCVGQGASLQDAIEQARRNGYEDPIMLFVPSDWTPAVLLPCV